VFVSNSRIVSKLPGLRPTPYSRIIKSFSRSWSQLVSRVHMHMTQTKTMIYISLISWKFIIYDGLFTNKGSHQHSSWCTISIKISQYDTISAPAIFFMAASINWPTEHWWLAIRKIDWLNTIEPYNFQHLHTANHACCRTIASNRY